LILSFFFSFSQLGGNYIFQFVTITNSARIASLGGENVSLNLKDLSTVFHNPALLDSSMNGNITLNYINYISDINFYYSGYAKNLNKLGTFALGVYYFNYGKFLITDELGYKYGTFTPSDWAFYLSYSKKIDSSFSIGITSKFIYSDYIFFKASGLAFDLGAIYKNKEKKVTIGTAIRNLGIELMKYNPDKKREPLPIDWQIGITKKVAHAPFRISLTYTHLEKFDLTYTKPLRYDEDTISYIGNIPTQKKELKILDYADKALRHMVLGIEFIPFKNFYISLGYNYRRRAELKLDARPGLVGFSIGTGIKISKFFISYGRALYHLAGASNVITISTNVDYFYNRIIVKH